MLQRLMNKKVVIGLLGILILLASVWPNHDYAGGGIPVCHMGKGNQRK